jgi:hypothetical protein
MQILQKYFNQDKKFLVKKGAEKFDDGDEIWWRQIKFAGGIQRSI